MRLRGLILLVALAGAGCVASQDKALISTGGAVADGDLANWDKLSDSQKKAACWKLARALHVLDYSICGVPLAPQWALTTPPWAAPVVTATGTPK